MQLKVHYNRGMKLAAVGPSAWAKLGPERWFNKFIIVCANARAFTADYIVDLGMQAVDIERFKTQFIIDSEAFKSLAAGKMVDYRFVVYKPVNVPSGLGTHQFIANPITFSRFENKRVFREVFAGKLPIPEHRFVAFSELLDREPDEAYEQLSQVFGERFVVQDEKGSGNRGTFVVASAGDMARAIQILRKTRLGDVCVVSRFIRGIERSIQVFVSADKILAGPLQQQLLRHPELLNPDGQGGMFFCGGRFIYDPPADLSTQVNQAVENAAKELQAQGYRGMFGLDFLVDEGGKLYAIEINARTTGVLPLLNEQTTAVPLYLLHILELTDESYEVLPGETDLTPQSGPQSFVVLFNKNRSSSHLSQDITTGNYRFKDGKLERLDNSPRWHREADCMIQLFATEEIPAPPNYKLCNIFLRSEGFDDKGNLSDFARDIVAYLKSHTITV